MKLQTQKSRIFVFSIYLFFLFVASRISLNSWLPPTSVKGLWFYAGLASLILGDLIASPFYTKPADAIVYAVPAIIGLLGVNVFYLLEIQQIDQFLWFVTLIYITFIVISGILCIALKDSSRIWLKNLSSSFFTICDKLGGARPIYSSIFLFAIVTFHRSNAREFITIIIAWAISGGLRPLENMFSLFTQLRKIWTKTLPIEFFGKVFAHHEPGITFLKHQAGKNTNFGDPIAIRTADGRFRVGIALKDLHLADESWTRVLNVSDREFRENIEKYIGKLLINPGEGIAIDAQTFTLKYPNSNISYFSSNLIGIVDTDTNVDKLNFEIVHSDLDIAEGLLVSVCIGEIPVLYQVIDGFTKEEILYQKNTYGYARGHAKKVGVWNENKGRFEQAKWIPNLNDAVYLVKPLVAKPKADAIGFFPSTDYQVSMNINDLVTHNCAILGILGSGKTFLALELVERMIKEKIKVICLDLTNQYAEELTNFYDEEAEKEALEKIAEVGPPGKDNCQQNVEEGGSVIKFREALRKDLKAFLNPESKVFLKIYNPVKFEVWRQDSKPFRDRASMATLTSTEITKIIIEETLDLSQDVMSLSARACIVFEEAHSLIPEWSSAAVEGDRAATNATAKAILQGRKYGLGCLVVTQRTANVTKSILNQCNTVFALRVFDATGMEFLRNYIGEDYAGVLSTLQDRHAVVFGKASSCKQPVLVRLNDRDKFIKVFRESITQKNNPST